MPLAGRLATFEPDSNTISFGIDCNNAGALFIHAKADGVTISDIVKPVYVPSIVHSFFPLNGMKNYEGVSTPLLGVQVTELVDGIFVGCTVNHSLLCIDYAIRIPRSYVQQFHEDFPVPPLKERVFHFTKESIANLKAKANAEVGTNKISSLQALLSHLWRSVIRNKNLDPNEEIHYYVVIRARQRLHELPEQYFGNAVKTDQCVTVKVKELLEQGTGNIAWKMNRMVATNTEEDFKKVLELWIASPKLLKLASWTNKALVTSSSPRFNIYGNNFGWGRPIAVRSGSANKFYGKITVYCGAEEGSIDIEACVSPETLDAGANDQEFMDTVTI
ncbi:hypothetical protein CRYUN_Cryun15aG0119800 [Craigia yunnanensis]